MVVLRPVGYRQTAEIQEPVHGEVHLHLVDVLVDPLDVAYDVPRPRVNPVQGCSLGVTVRPTEVLGENERDAREGTPTVLLEEQIPQVLDGQIELQRGTPTVPAGTTLDFPEEVAADVAITGPLGMCCSRFDPGATTRGCVPANEMPAEHCSFGATLTVTERVPPLLDVATRSVTVSLPKT